MAGVSGPSPWLLAHQELNWRDRGRGWAPGEREEFIRENKLDLPPGRGRATTLEPDDLDPDPMPDWLVEILGG